MEPRQLLRCAPHHVRSDFRSADTVVGGLVEARRAVAELKSRGVTRFLDLNRVNKRSIDDVDDDEEADEGEDLGIVEPPMRRRRAEDGEPASGALDLGNDGDIAEPEDYSPSIAPADDLPAVPTAAPQAVPPALPPAVLPAGNEIPDDDTIPTEPGEDTPINVDDEAWNLRFHLLLLPLPGLEHLVLDLLKYHHWVLPSCLSMNELRMRTSQPVDSELIGRKLLGMDLNVADLLLLPMLSPIPLPQLPRLHLLHLPRMSRPIPRLFLLRKLIQPFSLLVGLSMLMGTFNSVINKWIFGKFVLGV